MINSSATYNELIESGRYLSTCISDSKLFFLEFFNKDLEWSSVRMYTDGQEALNAWREKLKTEPLSLYRVVMQEQTEYVLTS